MSRVIMYSTRFCPYCVMAQRLLDGKGVTVEKVMVDAQPERRTEMEKRSGGQRTVPQIFINDVHVGGYTDLARKDAMGELDDMLGRGDASA